MNDDMVNFSLIGLTRKIRGYTQGEVAELSGISQSKYSKIEKGIIEVNEETLIKLAATLKFPPRFFYQNADIAPALTPLVPFRKRANLNLRAIEAAEAEGNLYRLFLNKLLDNDQLLYQQTSYQQEVDDDYSPADIAKECRRILGIAKGPIYNLTEVLEDNGFFIIDRELPKKIDGFTLLPTRNVKASHIIFLNKDCPGDRMRFSLAHELGHIVMHRNIEGNIEEEANQFASELLMPEDEIIPYLREIKSLYDFIPIKKIWRVSIQALLNRAKDLKIISTTQHKSFYARISHLGYRQKEPAPIPIEKPSLLVELNRAYKCLGFRLSEILDLLCISKENYFEYFDPPLQPKPLHEMPKHFSSQSTKHLKIVKR